MKKHHVAAVLAVIMAAVLAGPAGATTILGQTGGTTPCIGGSLLFNTATVTANSYVVPAGAWRVTFWSTQGGVDTRFSTTAEQALLVLRATGVANQYTVVAVSDNQNTTTIGLHTFAVNLDAQGGDIIGLWAGNGSICANRTRNAGDVVAGFDEPKPPVGQQVTVVPSTGFTVNVSATLEPRLAAASARGGYCMPAPVLRSDGTFGSFVDLVFNQNLADSRYTGAYAANYAAGKGLTCDALPGYLDAGYKVDPLGLVSFDPKSNIYEYFKKA